jgi:hypothetical protein
VRWARDPNTGRRYDAFEYRSNPPPNNLACPRCPAAVIFRIRIGRGSDPGFAHASGAADPDCDDFHQTHQDSAATHARVAVKEDDNELGLAVEQLGSDWTLFLRVPELPDAELGVASLGGLREGYVEIFAGEGLVSCLSGLDVRPGTSITRAPVPPSLQEYRTQPAGRWPDRVNLERWHATAAGLAATGSLFRLRGGEWVRLRENSLVRWGEHLTLIADDRCPPPTAVRAERADTVSTSMLRWRLWRVWLPAQPSEPVEAWIERLGYVAATTAWAATVLSVPTSFTGEVGPCFHRDEPVIVALTPPDRSSNAMLRVTHGTNTHCLSLSPRGQDRFYVATSAATPSKSSLEVIGEGSTSTWFEIVEPPGAEAVGQQLTGVPRLRVWIGSHSRTAWSAAPAGTLPRKGEVRIDVGVEGARVDVVVRSRGARRVFYTNLSPRDAERAIDEALADAVLVEVDAGNLGRVELPLNSVRPRDTLPALDRLSGWLRCASACAHPRSDSLPVFAAGGAGQPRLSLICTDARLLPHVRALSRRCRQHWGASR